MSNTTLRLDSRGRITIPKEMLSTHVSGFRIKQKGSHLILEAVTEIPLQERWVFEDKEAISSLKRGLKDAERGRFSKLPNDINNED